MLFSVEQVLRDGLFFAGFSDDTKIASVGGNEILIALRLTMYDVWNVSIDCCIISNTILFLKFSHIMFYSRVVLKSQIYSVILNSITHYPFFANLIHIRFPLSTLGFIYCSLMSTEGISK